MRILAVDDERLALENISALLKKVLPGSEINGFTKSLDAFAWLSSHRVDIAFLDIEMGDMNGLNLAKKCKDLCPNINIIFVTGYSRYTMDALRLHASGYLIKPVREKDLRVELDNLRHPLPASTTGRVRIQTFGNFEVFVDQNPLLIPQQKCRECLAYVVDRKGARVTAAELAALLWGDVPYDRRVQNNTHRVIADTIKYLKDAGIAEILLKNRGDLWIDVEKVDCDYYHFINGDVAQINAFHGEYMTNYSWAEFTLAELGKVKATY